MWLALRFVPILGLLVALLCLSPIPAGAHPPTGIAVDRDGNVYIVDVLSHAVFKVAPDGRVRIIAGSGTAGYADGLAGQAKFDHPHSLALDVQGNLYVGDYDGHRVRKITAEGRVTTLAGSGEIGLAEGLGRSARIERPAALAVDGLGNVYVSHDRNDRISKIIPNGAVSAWAAVERPRGIATDLLGNLYVAAGDHTIRKISVDGRITILAGSQRRGFADGQGTAAEFDTPWGIAVDDKGNLYIADMYNHRVRKMTPDGTVTTLAGSGERGFADGAALRAKFDSPSGITVDRAGNVYVLEGWERPGRGPRVRLRKISPEGLVTTMVN